jgi:O-antigen/teichoic acid export membrane protein
LIKILSKFIINKINFIKIFKNIGWLSLDRIFRTLIGLFVGVWLARFLGPEDYGLLSYAGSIIALFGSIQILGFDQIAVKQLVINPKRKEEILGSIVFCHLIIGLILFLIFLYLNNLLLTGNQKMYLILLPLSILILLRFYEFTVYWFESQILSKYTVWVSDSVILLIAIIKIILILNSSPLIYFVWAIIAESFLIALIMIFIFHNFNFAISKLKVNLKVIKSLLRLSWPFIILSLALMLNLKIDKIMIGNLIDDKSVGIYAIASRLTEICILIPVIISASIFPALIKAKKTNNSLYLLRIQKLFDLLVLISLAMCIPISLFSSEIIIFIFGEQYKMAASILSIHIWSCVFAYLAYAGSRWYIAEDMQKKYMMNVVLGSILNICLNFILLKIYGIKGSAIATIITFLFVGLISDIFNKKTRILFSMKFNALNLIALYYRNNNFDKIFKF